jgi:hypothetical protein
VIDVSLLKEANIKISKGRCHRLFINKAVAEKYFAAGSYK